MTPKEVAERDRERAKATAADASRRGTNLLAQVAVHKALGHDTADALDKLVCHERDWWFLAAALLSWAASMDEGTHLYLTKAIEVAVDSYLGEDE